MLMTIIDRRGSAPREVGAKMILSPDEKTVGTIGGGCAEAAVLAKARFMLTGKDVSVRIEHVDMTDSDAGDEGMVCGGAVDVLIELI